MTVYVFANSPALTYVKKHKITYRTMKVLTVPKDLTSLSESVFNGSGCEAVIIQEGCKTIGHHAFANCPDLVYVRIPASVTSRAGDAFYNSGKPYLDILK